MNNKNNNKKLAVLTAMVAITAILLNNAVFQSANAIYEDEVKQFIQYKDLAPNQIHEKYLGYHLVNDHVFLWYKNNLKNGFYLDQFLSEAQQKIQDETGIRQ